MELNELYIKTRNALNNFRDNEINLAPFHNITREICGLIKDNNISYSDLSNEGKLFQHSVNVAILSGKLGIFYNVDDIYNLVLGSLMHDFGKLYVNQSILNKKGKLNDIEKIIIKEHSTLGYKVISYFTNNEIVTDIVLEHHEVFKDIPQGTDIMKLENKRKYPLICGIADITDAVLSYRPYKRPLPKEIIFIDLSEKGIINYENKLNVLLEDIA